MGRAGQPASLIAATDARFKPSRARISSTGKLKNSNDLARSAGVGWQEAKAFTEAHYLCLDMGGDETSIEILKLEEGRSCRPLLATVRAYSSRCFL